MGKLIESLRLKYWIFVFCIVFSFSLSAQVNHDLELWTGAKVDVKLHKKIELKFDGQVRFNKMLSRRKSTLFELGLAYDPLKWLSLTPSYRVTNKGQGENYGRTTLDIELDFDLSDNWKFENRTRGQYEYLFNGIDRTGKLRNKTQLDYNLSKLFDPYASLEFFYTNQAVEEYRFRIGGTWRINKKIDLNTFYTLESELGKKTNDKAHIFGLYVKINLDARKKNK